MRFSLWAQFSNLLPNTTQIWPVLQISFTRNLESGTGEEITLLESNAKCFVKEKMFSSAELLIPFKLSLTICNLGTLALWP